MARTRLTALDTERLDSWTEVSVDGATKRHIFTQPGFPRPFLRPSDAAHHVAPSAGKGRCVYATRAIQAGELILAERPLLLAPRGIPTVSALPQHFTATQRTQANMAEWDKHLLPERRDASIKLANCHEQDGSGPIVGCVRTNDVGASGLCCCGEKRDLGAYATFYDELSRINHSCRPNAICQFNLPTFSGRLRAVRDVSAGEESTTAYMDKLLLPSTKRQEILAPYGFTCACETCIAGEASDSRRAALQTSSSSGSSTSPGGLLKSYPQQIQPIKDEGLQTELLYYNVLFHTAELLKKHGDQEECLAYVQELKQFNDAILDSADVGDKLDWGYFRVY